ARWASKSANRKSQRRRRVTLASRRRAEDRCDGFGVADEAGALGAQVRAAGGGELVIARAPVVVGKSPLGSDECPFFHAMERVVEGALLDIEMAAGARLEPRRDLRAVHGAPGECLQDEDVERPLEERAVLRSHNVSPESLEATMCLERDPVKIKVTCPHLTADGERSFETA